MLNVSMNQLGTVYATKRRRRNGKSLKPPPKDGVTKSNPSKRHRERLNAELDTLAALLPFEQNILSKLDRLSILRLAVSYLRTKSYFQVSMVREKDEASTEFRNRDLMAYDHTPLDGELFLQALNGFLLILTCDGEVFFATHSIESYLGFHQSDIVHQSVYELVHSEDREELQRQLMWNAFFPSELSGMSLQETVHTPDQCHFLERSFTVRFRCLLDNTSGFLRLDIRGRVKVLHGQNRKSEEPPLALFALCTPFGPPSLLEVPQKEVMFKSKHKLDLSLVSMDQRGKMLLCYTDGELTVMGGYDLVHFDDLAYVASAHQELLKTGASGLIAYRLQAKDGQWQWLQTSSRLVYKNSKPDFIISTHRPLMEEEGRDLMGKRTMDFKVSYLDAGLTNSYFSDQDSTPIASTPAPAPKTRRYKTQLRDFLASCRSKRKIAAGDYVADSTTAVAATASIQHIQQAAAAAAATSYPAPYNCNVYGSSGYGASENNLYVQQQNFYHHPANFENRYLDSSPLFQYRTLGTYYPEYNAAAYVGNGFLDVSRGCLYDNQYGKDPSCQLDYKNSHNSYANLGSATHQSLDISKKGSGGEVSLKSDIDGNLKREDYMMHYTNGNDTRQTVLMWGSSPSPALTRHNSVIQSQGLYVPSEKKYCSGGSSSVDPLRSLSEMNSAGSSPSTTAGSVATTSECKWGVGSIIKSSLGLVTDNGNGSGGGTVTSMSGSHNHNNTPTSSSLHHHHDHHSTSASVVIDNSSAMAAAKSLYLQSYHPSSAGVGVGMTMGIGTEQGSASEFFGSRYLLPYGDKQDRSPLLSISEVTNTLLNHD